MLCKLYAIGLSSSLAKIHDCGLNFNIIGLRGISVCICRHKINDNGCIARSTIALYELCVFTSMAECNYTLAQKIFILKNKQKTLKTNPEVTMYHRSMQLASKIVSR